MSEEHRHHRQPKPFSPDPSSAAWRRRRQESCGQRRRTRNLQVTLPKQNAKCQQLKLSRRFFWGGGAQSCSHQEDFDLIFKNARGESFLGFVAFQNHFAPGLCAGLGDAKTTCCAFSTHCTPTAKMHISVTSSASVEATPTTPFVNPSPLPPLHPSPLLSDTRGDDLRSARLCESCKLLPA